MQEGCAVRKGNPVHLMLAGLTLACGERARRRRRAFITAYVNCPRCKASKEYAEATAAENGEPKPTGSGSGQEKEPNP